MQGILQFILGNLWILVPILIGLFNVGVRMQQKAKEQRAKRAALAEIQRRKADALRTGKPVNEPVIVYDEPQKTAKQAQQDERKARIEALRQQRMEQLRAMREKRASSATAAVPTQQPRRQTPTQQRQPGTLRTPQLKPRGPQPARPSRPRVIPQSRPQARPQAPAPSPSRPRVVEPTSKPTPIPESSPGLDSGAPVPRKIEPCFNPISSSKQSLTGGSGDAFSKINARRLLRDPRLTRQAIVARELLDAPISERDPDRSPGSMPS